MEVRARRPSRSGADPSYSPVVTRDEYEQAPRDLLNRGNRRNPDVYRVGRGAAALVVKDFAPRGRWVRATLGRWLTRREARAWQALRGHPNVPAFRGSIDELAFAVEYRPGRRMSRKLANEVSADFCDRLEEAVAEMHRRGVVHLDLRHRSNVMVGDDGAPVLVDFGSALCLRPGGFAAWLLLRPLAAIDRRAVLKWRVKLAPGVQASSAASPTGGSSGRGRGASRPT